MKVSINLLQETQKIRMRLRQMGLAIQTASIVALIVFGLLVFLLFSYTLILGRKQTNLSKLILEQKTAIESLRAIEAKQVFIQQKIELAEKVAREPSLPYELTTELYDLVSSRVKMREMHTVKGEGAILLGGEAEDIFSLVEFLDEFVGFADEHGATALIGDSFMRNVEGMYKFQMSLIIGEGQ